VNHYRVQLDVYNGPMDLLLYLIRKEEVDIYDIPIAHITEQYLGHMELLKALDVNLAAEFLVLAATLMEIKSRMLLPHPPPLEEGEEADPRAELVQELLEYKKFRDAAGELKERAEEQKLKYPRLAHHEVPVETDSAKPLREVELWDIFAAFRKLMKETMGRLPNTIVYDDIPVSEFMDGIVIRLRSASTLSFWEVFEGRRDRMYVVGTFLALLELIRRRLVLAVQREPFGEILLQLRPTAEHFEQPGGEDATSAQESEASTVTEREPGPVEGAEPPKAPGGAEDEPR